MMDRSRAHLRLVDEPSATPAPSPREDGARRPIDPAIVSAAAQGNEQAFTALVQWYHPRFVRFARHMLRNDAEADDAVQDAFIRVYRALPQYKEQEKFEPWIFRILANCCRTFLARNRRHSVRLVALGSREAREVYQNPDVRNDAAWRSLLGAALEQLPVDQREAFLLHYVEGHSYDTMAALTGVRHSALKMRVKRAGDRLRALLGADHG
jgi:RNA polymerase sigma-70 factor (ECF subfamily)